MRKLIKILLLIQIIFPIALLSQGSAGNGASYETRSIVDMPTAGVIPKDNFSFDLINYSGGGVSFAFNYAFYKNFNVGLALSGEGFVGSGDMKIQNVPSINVKFRFLDESINIPAMLIGISTQGSGNYDNNSNRFSIFSPGVYLALSKNFNWDAGDLAIHGGLNYSFENPDEDFDVNYYVGLEQSFSSRFAVNLEYNAAVFERKLYDDTDGFLNSSLRYSIGSGFTLQLQLRNLLESKRITRFLGIEYINRF